MWRNAAAEWQRPFAVAAGLTARGCSRRLQRLASDFALETPFGRAAHRYLSNRRDQLDYPAALAAALPLGSGLIESGHRHVLHHRLKIPGAAWVRANSDAIAHARVVRAHGAWPAYWHTLALAQN